VKILEGLAELSKFTAILDWQKTRFMRMQQFVIKELAEIARQLGRQNAQPLVQLGEHVTDLQVKLKAAWSAADD